MSATRVAMRLTGECFAFTGRLLGAAVALAALAAAQLGLTWIVKLWTEDLVASGGPRPANELLAAGLLVTGAMPLAVFVSRYLINTISQRLVQRLRDAAHRRLLAMPVTAVQQRQAGELVSRILSDTSLVSGFVRDVLWRVIGEGLVVVGAGAMMFYLHWRLALMTFAVAPVLALLLSRLGIWIRRRSARALEDLGELHAILGEQLAGLTTVKGFCGEAHEHVRFARRNARYRDAVLHSEWWAALMVASVWLVTGVGLVGAIWYGGEQVAGGRFTPAALMAFCLYAAQTVQPLRHLSDVHGLLQRVIAAAARVYEVIDGGPVEDAERGARLPGPRGALCFERVHFHYRSDAPVFQALDLHIAAGETVGEGLVFAARHAFFIERDEDDFVAFLRPGPAVPGAARAPVMAAPSAGHP